MNPKLKKGRCLIEGCPHKNKIYARGLCLYHYRIMGKTVRQGKHTWEEFEEHGMSNKPHFGRRSYLVELFEKMLAKKIKQK